MGMFDEITIDMPHAAQIDEAVRGSTFQTKSLENAMFNYRITADGRLTERPFEMQRLPDEECEYYGTPEWEQGGIYRVMGTMRRIDLPLVDIQYHGDIVYYTHTGHNGESDYQWYEYQARFTDGNLMWIKRINER